MHLQTETEKMRGKNPAEVLLHLDPSLIVSDYGRRWRKNVSQAASTPEEPHTFIDGQSGNYKYALGATVGAVREAQGR